MYKSIYFDELGIIASKDFDNLEDANADKATHDWGVVVSFSESRTITTIEPEPEPEEP